MLIPYQVSWQKSYNHNHFPCQVIWELALDLQYLAAWLWESPWKTIILVMNVKIRVWDFPPSSWSTDTMWHLLATFIIPCWGGRSNTLAVSRERSVLLWWCDETSLTQVHECIIIWGYWNMSVSLPISLSDCLSVYVTLAYLHIFKELLFQLQWNLLRAFLKE